jgi:predicted ester cyclase
MKFDIKEVLVAGDRVIVRGEVTGTPAGELFGVPHTGKSFRIMAIDIQTIKDGKIAKTFHMENWLSALGQLREVMAPSRVGAVGGQAQGTSLADPITWP